MLDHLESLATPKPFKNSNIGKKLEWNELGIPGSRPLPSDDNGKCMPFVNVGDEDFALPEHVLQSYPNGHLGLQKRIYSYRLTRVRRMVRRMCILYSGKLVEGFSQTIRCNFSVLG